ncbi:MAG: ABC transporter substrate-binding protein [Bacteroidales bacterium]|nr:ABC transporter substrate-binding protein [Bacteroidales bacterium]
MPFLAFFFIIIVLFSCSNQHPVSKTQTNQALKNKYARHFAIVQSQNGVKLNIINYYQDAKNETLTYDIHQLKINIPIKRCVVLSSTHIGFLDALQEISSIVGCSNLHNVYNANLLKLIKEGKVIEVGYDQNIQYETIINLKPDIVFAYAIGKKDMPYINKLHSLGIPVIYTSEFLEPDPLGRAEWIKFFAFFYGKETLADSIFNQIEQSYINIKRKGEKATHNPSILLNVPYDGTWYLPGCSSYIVKLIKDAGGKYIFDTLCTKDIYPMNIEWVTYYGQNADIWLNTGIFSKKEQLSYEGFKQIKAYRNNKLYNHIKTKEFQGASKFWEQGVIKPHLILEDLYHIFHTNDSLIEYHFYQQL